MYKYRKIPVITPWLKAPRADYKLAYLLIEISHR